MIIIVCQLIHPFSPRQKEMQRYRDEGSQLLKQGGLVKLASAVQVRQKHRSWLGLGSVLAQSWLALAQPTCHRLSIMSV